MGSSSNRRESWRCGFLSRLLVDRKSTRLNSSHVKISYAGFCLKKQNKVDDQLAYLEAPEPPRPNPPAEVSGSGPGGEESTKGPTLPPFVFYRNPAIRAFPPSPPRRPGL